MEQIVMDFTLGSIIFAIACFLLFSCALWVGRYGLPMLVGKTSEGGEDFRIVSGALLTLLGLLIGFSMSMSIGGFNDRQATELNEAIAIRTAYLRADLLPHDVKLQVKAHIKTYLRDRIALYKHKNLSLQSQLQQRVFDEQAILWTLVTAPSLPKVDLVTTSINDLVTAHQEAMGGWYNHVPRAIWGLLVIIGTCCCLLMGYNARKITDRFGLMLFLPAMIALSFLIIAEIDVPGYGVIHVKPVNLVFVEQNFIDE